MHMHMCMYMLYVKLLLPRSGPIRIRCGYVATGDVAVTREHRAPPTGTYVARRVPQRYHF